MLKSCTRKLNLITVYLLDDSVSALVAHMRVFPHTLTKCDFDFLTLYTSSRAGSQLGFQKQRRKIMSATVKLKKFSKYFPCFWFLGWCLDCLEVNKFLLWMDFSPLSLSLCLCEQKQNKKKKNHLRRATTTASSSRLKSEESYAGSLWFLKYIEREITAAAANPPCPWPMLYDVLLLSFCTRMLSADQHNFLRWFLFHFWRVYNLQII